jgi:stage II sporulation protein D
MWAVGQAHIASAREPTDRDLERASATRTVQVRVGGRVTRVPVELYVARVIAGEGEPDAPDAAQQALAIAIRTFAAANMGRHRRNGFDLCDATHCQVLRGSTPASRRAALATAGQVLKYAGRPADVFYSASCGGRSEAVAEVWPGATDHPYLPSIADDVHEGELPWVLEVPAARVHRVLRDAGFNGRTLKDLRVERRTPSGRVSRLHLEGMRPDTMSGHDFRAAFGARELRSTAFTVEKIGRAYRFTGRGYGHGVGMCVIGAGRRAARGESTAQILQQYYPGLELTAGR